MSEKRIDALCGEIEQYVHGHGCENVTIGLSGGKDSTVAAALCARALGPTQVVGVWMPAGSFVGDHGVEVDEDVRRVCEDVGIVNFMVVGIGGATGMIQHQVARHVPISNQARINIQPRLRMTTLYCVSQSYGKSLVINTTNLDETIACYGTVSEHLFDRFSNQFIARRSRVLRTLVSMLDDPADRKMVYELQLLPDKVVQRMILDRLVKNLFKLKEINVHGIGGDYVG